MFSSNWLYMNLSDNIYDMQHKEITEYLGEFQKFQETVNKIGAKRQLQNLSNTKI